MVQFLFRYGKTERAGSIPQSQGASRPWTGSKSKTKTTTTPACKKNCHSRRPCDEPLERHAHAGASASSSHEDRKDAVDQARVPGDTACGAANSPRNVRGGRQRVCKKSRLARDTPPRRAADRILQRREPVLTIAGGVVGYVKAGSVASIIAGSIAGVLLLVAAFLLPEHRAIGLATAFIISLLLAAQFVPKFIQTGRVMPAGMMSILSVIGVIAAIVAWVKK